MLTKRKVDQVFSTGQLGEIFTSISEGILARLEPGTYIVYTEVFWQCLGQCQLKEAFKIIEARSTKKSSEHHTRLKVLIAHAVQQHRMDHGRFFSMHNAEATTTGVRLFPYYESSAKGLCLGRKDENEWLEKDDIILVTRGLDVY
jgi:hypothetical protein